MKRTTMKNSRYNFAIPAESGAIVFCAKTGAAMLLQGMHHKELAKQLCSTPQEIRSDTLPEATYLELLRGGFIIPIDHDELTEIQNRYIEARETTPLVMTITTTMDCNLGCYYCYEERSTNTLKAADASDVVCHVETRIEQSKSKSLHVDWYGGEPLLNQNFLELTSPLLQQLCQDKHISYSASIISNGTCWPEDVHSFIERHRIRQVQISFDGLRENHNKRRRYRIKTQDSLQSSFDEAVRLIDNLIKVVRVDARINIDRENSQDVIPLVEFMELRGWFSGSYPVFVQPARLASYSDRSSFMRSHELSVEEYDQIRDTVRKRIGKLATVEESESPDGYPWPKSSVCAALARHSDVIGADGYLYRCGLQVSEPHRRIEKLTDRDDASDLLPIIQLDDVTSSNDKTFWDTFDPCKQPNCCRCSFLPICWGGCPKKHLEQDHHALAEQGKYWRNNLARLVSQHLGLEPSQHVYSEVDQFREPNSSEM